MTRQRVSHEDRRKILELAIKRIEKGRSKTGEMELSVAAVARETGVSAALIHNRHPDIAEEIGAKRGRSSRAYGEAKKSALLELEERNQELRATIDKQRAQIALLASRNETLEVENCSLKAQVESDNVLNLRARRSGAGTLMPPNLLRHR